MRKGAVRSKVGITVFSTVLVATGTFTTAASAAPAQLASDTLNNERKTVHLPRQPLQDALIAFSQQTGIQTSVDAALVRGRTAPAVSGNLTAPEILARLLSGSGLSSQFSDASTVLIVPRPAGTQAGADTITVTAGQESATGPVQGYRAARSVTASKTDTPLRDLPQAVQVVPRGVLEDQQVNSLTDALKNVSGVQQTGTSGNRAETFAVRGFSAPAYAIDGVMLNPVGDRPETFLDMVDVERIEVLKGPASALYGRGQPGGLINILTRRPDYDFSGHAAVQSGSFGFWRGESSISGPLNQDKTLTGRLSAAAQTERGFRDNRSRSDRQYGSMALYWEPSVDTRFTFAFNQTHQDMPFDRGLVVTPDNKINLPRERYLGEEWSSIDARKTSVSLGAEHHVNEQITVRGYLRYDDAYVHDTGIDYRSLEDDGRTLNRRYTDRVEDLNNLDAQFETQLDFSTASIEHTLLTGVQYGHSRMNFSGYRANIAPIDIYAPVYGAPKTQTRLDSEYRETIRMASVFVQDQMTLSPKWKVMGGLRYDHVRQQMRQKVGDNSPDINDGALTSRAGVVYQPTRRVALYANYAESFAPQSGETRDHQSLDPEEGWQIESGVKVDLIPDALSLTTAVFQITKSNVKASDPLDEDYSVTTGEQRVRGIELDVTGTLLPGWEVIASTALLDAEITKDEDYEVGNKLASIPRWSGSLWTTYELQSGQLSGLKFGSGVQAVSTRKGDLDNSYSVGGYYSLDAMVSWPVTKNLTLSVLGRNLTDQDYILTPVSRTENHPGAPRSVLATLKMTF